MSDERASALGQDVHALSKSERRMGVRTCFQAVLKLCDLGLIGSPSP
jgi:hypothetical protein